MKVYKYIENEYIRVLKLFGFSIYKQILDFTLNSRYQEFFGGLITTYTIHDKYYFYIEKNIKILNYSILKIIEDKDNKTYYIAGGGKKRYRAFCQTSLTQIFKKKYLRYFNKKYDHIYILNANSGEVYLFLTYILSAYLKKNNSKVPLIAATKKTHIELIKLLCPEIPYVYIKKLKYPVKKDVFNINNQKFFMLFSHEHFMNVEDTLKNSPLGTSHYFKFILQRLNMSESEISIRKVKVPFENEKSMLKKVNSIGLKIDNFIFIAPQAKSCQLIGNSFWIDLIKKYQFQGYDVFVNLVNGSIDLNDVDVKSCFLTYSEAFALAKRSRKIISLRSGFCELLLQTEVPMEIFYTKFRKRRNFGELSVDRVVSGFNLSHLPQINVSLIQENIINV